MKTIQHNDAVGYFDGSTKVGFYAVGVALYVNNNHIFKFKLHYGKVSNINDGLLALWCLCKIARVFGIVTLHVFGDSKVTIKWETREYNLKVLSLIPWCYRIKKKMIHFSNINFHHIYREHNQLADQFSKVALNGKEGTLFWEESLDNLLTNSGYINIFVV